MQVPHLRRVGARSLDVALVVGLALTCWRVFSPTPSAPPKKEATRARAYLELGQSLGLPASSLAGAERVVVLMLDTRCAACEGGASFYHSLADVISKVPGLRFIVLTDTSKHDAIEWLNRHDIRGANTLRVASRAQFGFMMTPTLVVLDSKGVITDLIESQLSADAERALLARLNDASKPPLRIAQSIREVFLNDSPGFRLGATDQVIDPRDRISFRQGHSERAINIPRDELLVRGPAELTMNQLVYLDCQDSSQQDCRTAGFALQDAGFKELVLVLRQ